MNPRKTKPRQGGNMRFKDAYELILSENRRGLGKVDESQVEAFVKIVLEVEKVFFIGVGRVMLSLQAMAKRFNHLGISAHCVGDINEPAITDKDVLVIGSGSGESVVPVAIAKIAHKHGARIVHIGSNPESSLASLTTLFVRIPVKTKLNRRGEIQSGQIMSSLFEQSLLLFGDSVALMLSKRKKINDLRALWRYHANLE